MTIQEARQGLDDTTFLLGKFRRRAALKELARSTDPDAATALVEAVDAKSPSSEAATKVLAANIDPTWSDRLWEIWAGKRQPWLGELLRQRGTDYRQPGTDIGVLSRLKLGKDGLPQDRATMTVVAARWRDADSQVQTAARGYAQTLAQHKRSLWIEMMLRLREFEAIGKDRSAMESVLPFLGADDAGTQAAVLAYCGEFAPFECQVLAHLLAGTGDSLQLQREVALSVASFLGDANPNVAAQARAYAGRVLEAQPDFITAFAFKCGQPDRLKVNRATTMEALRLRDDADKTLSAGARKWIEALPNDQQFNDAIVDDWLRSDDAFLFAILRDQRRLPSDGGRETLLRLLLGDAGGYRALADADGRLLAEALAMANENRRSRIVQTIQDSRDAALADQLRRASLRVQGMDAGLALSALMASGDEDRIVDAAREMTGRELFVLCRRWIENGRRPADPKKRAAVDLAVTALKNQPAIEVEPAEPLPSGLVDLFDAWRSRNSSDEELRRDLEAQDPVVRGRALFLGSERGVVDEAALRTRAGSTDWPERLVAALRGAHAAADKDHVYWVAQCAGEDQGTHQALVACGPDEFERAEALLVRLRATGTTLARRVVAELEALQAFRALEKTTITVTTDDSATVKGGLTAGDVTADEFASAFGGAKTAEQLPAAAAKPSGGRDNQGKARR